MNSDSMGYLELYLYTVFLSSVVGFRLSYGAPKKDTLSLLNWCQKPLHCPLTSETPNSPSPKGHFLISEPLKWYKRSLLTYIWGADHVYGSQLSPSS